MNSDSFWQELDRLAAECPLVIDRPRGSRHPHYPEMIYPYDYGYLEGTQAADGGGIDCWVGSLPHKTVGAVICALDHHKRDAEIKILLGCTPAEARDILALHNRGLQSALLIEREPGPA